MAFYRHGKWKAKIEAHGWGQVWLGTFETEQQADEAERQAKWRVSQGLPPKEPRLTFDDYSSVWFASKRSKAPSTKEDYQRALNRLSKHIGSRQIGSIRNEDTEALVELLEDDGYGVQTVRKTMTILGAVLKHARRKGQMDCDPPEIELPRQARAEASPLTLDEFHHVLKKCPAYWRPFFVVTACFGLRFSEAAGITWSDIDFESCRLRIRQGMNDGTLGPLKTRNAIREFALTPGMCQVLLEHRSKCPPSTQNLVFPTPQGSPLRRGNFYRYVMRKLKEDTGIEFSLHQLRKMYATELMQLDADMSYMLQKVGHADVATTHKHYIKLRERAGEDEYQHELDERFMGEVFRSESVASDEASSLKRGQRRSESPADQDVSMVPPARFERATPGLGTLPLGAIIDPDLAFWFAPWLRISAPVASVDEASRSDSVASDGIAGDDSDA